MTVREILRLALGGRIVFDPPSPDTEIYGPGAPVPPPEFIESLRARATAGEAEAQRELGLLAYRGRGVTEDRCEAFKWLTLAARQGDAKAAMAVFQANFDKYQGAWPTHVGMARGLSAIGDYPKALEHAKKALAQAPDPVNKASLEQMVANLGQGKAVS